MLLVGNSIGYSNSTKSEPYYKYEDLGGMGFLRDFGIRGFACPPYGLYADDRQNEYIVYCDLVPTISTKVIQIELLIEVTHQGIIQLYEVRELVDWKRLKPQYIELRFSAASIPVSLRYIPLKFRLEIKDYETGEYIIAVQTDIEVVKSIFE